MSHSESSPVDVEAVGRRRSDAVVALSWGVSWLAVLGELLARRSEMGILWARGAFDLLWLLAGLLLCALLMERGASSGRPSTVARLLAALGATLALLAGRWLLSSSIEPSVAAMSALLLASPGLLSWELVHRFRAGLRLTATSAATCAAAWCVAGGVAAIALTLGASRTLAPIGPVEAAAELRFLLLSICLAALVGAAVALRRRDGADAARFGVAGAAAGVGVALVDPMRQPDLWVVLCALGVIAAPIGRAVAPRSWSKRLLRWAQGAGHRSAARTRSIGRDLVATSAAVPLAARRPSTGDRWGAATMALASAAYVATGIWWAVRAGWEPTAHAATMLARASDVGTPDHPLLGMVTSLGGAEGGGAAHPGPLLMDLLAVPVKLLGLQRGALVGAAAAALVFWAVAVWSAYRAGGRAAAVGAWIVGALVLEVPALGATWESNNVTITMLAMFAATLAAWATSTGTWRAWWWVVFLSTLCAQAYLPHALVVLGPTVFAAVALAGAGWARGVVGPDAARRARRTMWIGVALIGALWAQPALEAVLHGGGNFKELLRQVTAPTETVGPGGVPRALAWLTAVPPRWDDVVGTFADAGGAERFIRGSVLAGLAVAAAVGWAWWRTRTTVARDERQLRRIVALVVIGAALNASQLPSEYLRSFQIGWLVTASLIVWYAVGLSSLRWFQRRVPLTGAARFARPAALGVGVVVIAAAILGAPDQIEDVKGPAFAIDPIIGPLVDQTVAAVDPDEPSLVVALDSRFNEATADTLLANLIVRGVDVRVEPGLGGLNYGQRRIADDGWRGPILMVASALPPVQPDGDLVATASVPGWSRADFDRIAAEIAAIAATAPEIRLEPWARDLLPRFLAGWLGDEACDVSQRILDGSRPLSSLPPGALTMMYADLAISSPTLPPELQTEALRAVGQAPVEVWRSDGQELDAEPSTNLQRDGAHCAAGVRR